jgi:hypothetical protein
MYARSLTAAVVMALTTSIALGQSQPSGSTPGGVWSKNMELICPLPLSYRNEHFSFAPVKADGTTKYYVILTEDQRYTTSGTEILRMIDVTNPYNLDKDALTIEFVWNTSDNRDPQWVKVERLAVWEDGRQSITVNGNNVTNPLYQHMLAIIYFSSPRVVLGDQTRFLIGLDSRT